MATAAREGGAPLAMTLFGPFEARVRGELIASLRSRKGYRLLALLALRPTCEVERGWLAGTLWPDSPDTQALANLRNTLKDLRHALGEAADRVTAPTPRTLALDLAGVDVDVITFDQAVAQGDPTSLERAVMLYRGPLLEGWLEEWAFQERQEREQAYLAALECLADLRQEAEDWGEAERYLRRVIAVDPTRETAQRGLMSVLAAGGNYAAAIETYRGLRLLLHHGLNVEPATETATLFQQIRAEARGKAAHGSGRPQGTPLPAHSSEEAHPAPCTSSPEPGAPNPETITFLFTDVEGSTRLWEAHPNAMKEALTRHDTLLHQVITAYGGNVFKSMGDQACAAFPNAPDALTAAREAQRALAAASWGETGPLRVRMALHTGMAHDLGDDYCGLPLSEAARLLDVGHGGQILLSLVTAELVRDYLPKGVSLCDLGVYRLKDLVRAEQIFQLLAPDLPREFPPLNTLDLRRHNLPVQPTSLIGREQELAAGRALLEREAVRLLTLTGPGGTGKTRLGLQIGADMLPAFPDGVFFVALAPLADPNLVASTIAQTLGVQEGAGQPVVESLKQYLQDRQILLLLDNFEHLLPAAPVVTALLESAPRLKILVTSRAALRLRGEKQFPVPPLAVPDVTQLRSVEQLLQYAAVDLFCQRALDVQPDFAITTENARAVAEICQRLDGLPLAIELAAARINSLSPQAISDRLVGAGLVPTSGGRPQRSSLRLLTSGSRDLPARQQTLRSAIGWSYDLLDESEKLLFRRLSVFVNGCTLEAAEAVCGADDDLGSDLLDGISSLADKSLLRQEKTATGEVRFVMLATIQEYALECLAASGFSERSDRQGDALRRQHARYFLAWAGTEALPPRLEAEHDNLRAALSWSIEHGDLEETVRLALVISWLWDLGGHWTEGRRWLERVLERPDLLARTRMRARALRAAGKLASAQGDYGAACGLLEEALAILREQGPADELPAALNARGEVAREQGDYESARSYFEESLTILREQDDRGGLPWALQALGQVAQQQGDESAQELFEESLVQFQALGDRWGGSFPLSHLGELARRHGDLLRARSLHEQSLAIRREVGHKRGIARSLSDLGTVAAAQREYECARSLYEESLALRRELGDKQGIVECLEGLAGVIVALGQPARSARLFGAAQALREALGAPRPAAADPAYERSLAAARVALSETAFAAAWANGRALPLEQVVAYALEETSGILGPEGVVGPPVRC